MNYLTCEVWIKRLWIKNYILPDASELWYPKEKQKIHPFAVVCMRTMCTSV